VAPMGWFGSSRRGAVWLALFALACQFAVAFGHVHLGSFSGGPVAGANSIRAIEHPPAGPHPPRQHPNRPDFCAICVNFALTGTLVAPASPLVLAPSLSVNVLLWPLATGEAVAFDHLTFDPRGPPLA
jgi:hypothetical protein